MFKLRKSPYTTNDLLTSRLYDQATFYPAFLNDLKQCTTELIIESPFITSKRMASLLPTLTRLSKRGVHIIINTRRPSEHDANYELQATETVVVLQQLGCTVLYTVGHHRKLAIIDRAITWEGSLNILSHNDSCEIMRRIQSASLSQQLVGFIKLEKYVAR